MVPGISKGVSRGISFIELLQNPFLLCCFGYLLVSCMLPVHSVDGALCLMMTIMVMIMMLLDFSIREVYVNG